MLLIPKGTQIVSRIALRDQRGITHPTGAVAVVEEAPTDPTHSYRVRFADGGIGYITRAEMSVRKLHQRAGLDGVSALEEHDLQEFVIYRCIVGSRAYGLDHEGSDTDLRGIYLPPADIHWSIYGVPEQLEVKESDECYWELQKFLKLALKANPNILECLYTPEVVEISPIAQELLAMREAFLSRLVYQTYNGYVLSQFKKLEQDMRTLGEIRTKHAMHLIRLLLSGITILEDGTVPVRIGEHREALLAIKNAQMPFEQVDRWRLELHEAFDRAYASTRLPERPDYERVNKFLIRARRKQIDG